MSTLTSLYFSLNNCLEKNSRSRQIFLVKKMSHVFFLGLREIIHLFLIILKAPQFAFETTAPRRTDGSYTISYQQYKNLQRKTRYSFLSSLIILFITVVTVTFYFPNFPGREPKIALAQSLYVTTTGNDANDCLSAGNACLTINGAIGKTSAGDTVNIAAGTYTESFGTSMTDITLNGADKNTTTLVGGIILNGTGNTIQNITINANGGIFGLDIRSAGGITVNNTIITGYSAAPGSVSAGIEIYRGASNITITNNRISGGEYGIHMGNAGGGDPSVSNITIRNNTIFNNTVNGIYFDTDPASNISIINNTLSSNTSDGISINFSANNFSNSAIRNNIIANNGRYGINFSNGGTPTNLDLSYNNIFGNTLGNYFGITVPTTDISVNPLFTNSAGNDYTLQSGSPSIDAGNFTDSYSNEPLPNGCRINQGAEGNTSSATTAALAICTFYVDATAGNDSNACTAIGTGACKTITQALSRASGGSNVTITVAAGTYSTETFPLSLRSGTTLEGAGASSTIVEIPESALTGLSLGAVATSLNLTGFTLNSSSANTNVIEFTNASSGISITQNIIRGVCQNGISFTPTSGTISNNIIRNCTTGITLSGASVVTIKNNTLYNNTTELNITGNTANATITNNILQHASAAVGSIGISRPGSATITNTYNNIYNHENNYLNLTAGTGEQSLDCRFTNVVTADFTFQSGSPCFDIGNPTETDPNGSRIDLGIYGGTASAGRASGRSRDTAPPSIPSNLKVSLIKDKEKIFARLTWTDPVDSDLRLIHILRGKLPLPPSGNEYGVSGAGNQSFIDNEIQIGESYQYMVRAVDKIGNISEASAPVDIVLIPPPAIEDLKILERGNDWFSLGFTPLDREKWNKAFLEIRYRENETITKENFETSERYEFASANEEKESVISELKLTGLKGDTLYNIAVRVHNNVMTSDISNVVGARTLDIVSPGPLENPELLKTHKENSKKTSSLSIAALEQTNLQETPTASVIISWNEPSDNGNSENSQNAVAFYDVRYAAKEITENNFNTFGEVVAYKNEWVPKNPGEIHEETISLIPITTKYIAIKACDEARNCSALTLFTVDLFPPPAISDLKLMTEKSSINTLTVQFTPIDKEKYPSASLDIRYFKDTTLTEENFSVAEKLQLNENPANIIEGEVILKNLLEDATYSIGIKVVNENGASKLSNIISGTTLDKTAPGKLENLALMNATTSDATLSWKETGDNGAVDTKKIASYIVRYSSEALSNENFNTAKTYAYETLDVAWVPLTPEETHQVTLYNLPNDTRSIGIVACDEVENCSEPAFLNITLASIGRRTFPEEETTTKEEEENEEALETTETPTTNIPETTETSSNKESVVDNTTTVPPGPALEEIQTSDNQANEQTAQDEKTNVVEPVIQSKPLQDILHVLSDKKTVSTPSPSSPVIQAVQKIVDNPVLEDTAVTVVAPVVTTVVLANVAAVSGGVNFLNYLQFLFTSPILLIARKRRKGWGIVYHSLTKKPIDLAIVRLFKRNTNQLIETRVTDKNGRYQFIVPQGKYYLTVTKSHFLFPTSYLEFKKSDTEYLDLYHGDTINITSDNENIALNIPLDPREKKRELLAEIIGKKLLRRSQSFIAFVGIILALVSFAVSPAPLILGLFFVHIILFLIFYRLTKRRTPKNWGVVFDAKTNKPIKHAIVRIFDKEFHRLLETQITDNNGRYAFLVGKNTYYITAEKDGFHPITDKQPHTIKIEDDNVIKLDIALAASKH